MSELPPDKPFIAAASADARRRKAAATQARGAQSFALTSERAGTQIPVGRQPRHLLRDPRGVASGPLGVALNLITAKQNGAA